MAIELETDCLILGGGIAGLWCLDAMARAGYQAILFSKGPIAAGQTLASQGIIHGGTKYSLEMHVGKAAEAIATMPARWQAALAGDGETDLSGVEIAAPRHLMWLPPQFAGDMMRFFASKAMRGRTETLAASDYPSVFADPAFQGSILSLDEVVLDVSSLISLLAERHAERIYDSAAFSALAWQSLDAQPTASFSYNGTAHHLACGQVLASAGAGNEALAQSFQIPQAATQRRPLRMVMLRHAPGPLWAHCVVKQKNPRLTITSHQAADGARIWYIGGDIAERCAKLTPGDTIDLARRELCELLPWLDFADCQWATLMIDRAEARQADKGRPDLPVLFSQGTVHLAWPTKLAFAPLLADQVLAKMSPPASPVPASGFSHLPRPEVGTPPWDEVGIWN